jgi:hypothetical protein
LEVETGWKMPVRICRNEGRMTRKSRMRIRMLLAICLAVWWIPSIPVFAAEQDPAVSESTSEESGAQQSAMAPFLDSMLDSVFGSGDDAGAGFHVHEMLEESITIIDEAFDDITGAGTEIGQFYLLLKAVALTIMTMYFVMGLASKDFTQQFGRPTMELLAKPFARFIVCLFVLGSSEWIMRFFLYLSHWCFLQAPDGTVALDGISGAMGDYKTAIYEIVKFDKTATGLVGIFRNMGAFMSLFVAFVIPWLISLISGFAELWVVYSRTANIIIMAVAAPLAMADLYGEHPLRETRAFGYIKEFAGLCFQSVVIAITYIAMGIIFSVFLEHFIAQAGDGSSLSTLGQLMSMGLKVSVFKLVQVGIVIGSANRAKKLMASM